MKNKSLLFILCMILCLSTANAQNYNWAKTYGSTGSDDIEEITIVQNQIFTVGTFSNVFTFGNTTLTALGTSDVFVGAMDTIGNEKWAIALTGNGKNEAASIAAFDTNNIYWSGLFWGDATLDTFSLSANTGLSAIFLAKADHTGKVNWVQTFRGSGIKTCNELTTDHQNNIYFTGFFSDTLWLGDSVLVAQSDIAAFTAKSDSNGTILWTSQAGVSGNIRGTCIITDHNGNTYVGGQLKGTATFGNTTLTAGTPDEHGFLVKYLADGSVDWAQKIGGNNDDIIESIATDAMGNVYITGYFVNVIRFDDGSLLQTHLFDTDVFVAKFAANGTKIWAERYGGMDNDYVAALAMDGNSLMLGGYFVGTTDFKGIVRTTPVSTLDGYVARLNTQDGNVQWFQQITGIANKFVADLYFKNEKSYVVGSFQNEIIFDNTTILSNGAFDGFVAQIEPTLTSIKSVSANPKKIKVFPNPTSDYLYFQNLPKDIQSLAIYNTLGQCIRIFFDVENGMYVGDLKNAYYFLKIKSNKKQVSVEFLKF